MKITFKGDYALKAVLDLSINQGKPQTILDIAKRQDIPRKFLEQIMISLKKGGFVKAQRGTKGGYLLTRSPSKITIGDVIRYIEGPVEPIGCVCKGGERTCSYSEHCSLRDVFDEVGKYISKKVDSVTFEELKNKQMKKMKMRGPDMYYI
jgi:Rrf2 family transcriptional regulator, cysteine metabolism repressor